MFLIYLLLVDYVEIIVKIVVRVAAIFHKRFITEMKYKFAAIERRENYTNPPLHS